MTKAIVFDLGMVLLGWSPEGFYDRTLGPEVRKALFADVDLYGMNLEIDRGRGLDAMTDLYAARHPHWATAIKLWHSHWPEMLTGPIDGSVALMARLRAAGYPIHALTNFARETLDIAQARYDVLTGFDSMVVSGDLGLVKPDPAIYAALEEQTGLRGSDLFFVDDRPENCAAAAQRGWTTHCFTDAPHLAQALRGLGLLTD